MLLTADTLLTGRELLRPGWIEVSDGAVQAVGAGAPPRPADHDLGAVTVVPGFVDTHLHGGGGANFSTALPAETATAAALHRAHGSTTVVASLVTAGPVELLRQVAALAEDVRAGVIAGIHLEDQVSPKRCGSPPTPRSCAVRPVTRPDDVDRTATPIPPSTRGRRSFRA